MKRWFLLLACFCLAQGAWAARVPDPVALERIEGIVREEIAAGHLPGAVVLVGGADKIYYRRAFGEKEEGAVPRPMTVDTVFDLASLTKVVATTTAVMQLVEKGRLDLDAPVARYWPAFAANGKAAISVRQLMTHYSGLPADLDLNGKWAGAGDARRLIVAERPFAAPGSRYRYSDVNFEVLGELVARVSGEPLDDYCRTHIFGPLQMHNTGFKPEPSPRIAPTEANRPGQVNDPTARRMGGIAGHAGLFSSADDLARFASMLLRDGALDGVKVLAPGSVQAMSLPQSPPGQSRLRGLGWDIGPPFAVDRDILPQVGAYGHTGYTGTSLWIDPVSGLYAILLSNRVYPDGHGDAGPLRDRLAALLGESLGQLSEGELVSARPALAGFLATIARPRVETGLDVLVAEAFAPLRGKRIGLITNQTGVDGRGRRNVDLMRMASGVQLVALFSPEHGLRGDQDGKVVSGAEPGTGIPVYSLYGKTRRPTAAMLEGIDTLVFDIQDAGVRFYTYGTTLAYAMEAAARKGIPIYVLDRPDPIGASAVQGPMLDPERTSFTGYWPMPVRHGMTMGELARFYNQEAGIHADLHVVAMRGYSRQDWFDDTGLTWVNPSPNLRSLTEAALYPGVGMIEGANVSVGRGTEKPFERIGAPWIDARTLAAYLMARGISGVSFSAAAFMPDAGPYRGQVCQGVSIEVTDREALDSPALGVELASALHRLYPDNFRLDEILGGVGSETVIAAIASGDDPRSIADKWRGDVNAFKRLRARYLIY